MTLTVAGVNFDHKHHMWSLLGDVDEHPDTEITALCDVDPDDPDRGVTEIVDQLGLDGVSLYESAETCLESESPDIVLLCPAAAEHGEWVERVAPYDVHVVLEKPMAATLAEADRIVDAMASRDRELVVNWPLAWYPSHRTTNRLIDEGRIGDVTEVHFYDGYTGPDRDTWFHDPDRGGGSLHDYLGYGVTLGTWFRDGDLPSTVSCSRYAPDESAVDTRSVTVAEYESGLSTYQTSWEPFTDPWSHQPQPTCGFVVCGTDGTIRSDDYAETVRVQCASAPDGTDVPVDDLEAPRSGPIEYLVHRITTADPEPFEPADPEFCARAQRIIESATRSAERGERVSLVER